MFLPKKNIKGIKGVVATETEQVGEGKRERGTSSYNWMSLFPSPIYTLCAVQFLHVFLDLLYCSVDHGTTNGQKRELQETKTLQSPLPHPGSVSSCSLSL